MISNSTGNYIVFDVPGSLTTLPTGIDTLGTVAGTYFDASSKSHSFYRLADGTLAIFDPTGSTGTYPTAVGPRGEVTGRFYDASGQSAFIRLAD